MDRASYPLPCPAGLRDRRGDRATRRPPAERRGNRGFFPKMKAQNMKKPRPCVSCGKRPRVRGTECRECYEWRKRQNKALSDVQPIKRSGANG